MGSADEARHGSSPLARGGLEASCRLPACGRLIPAGAGRTSPARPMIVGTWAHPRWRGEDMVSSALDSADTGSSPLAQGGHLQSCSFRSLNPLLDTTCPRKPDSNRADDGLGGHF